MNELKILEDIGANAVRRLRIETLASGQPFMINVDGLPKNQCYLEYPDQNIQLVTFDRDTNDFTPIKNLEAGIGMVYGNALVCNALTLIINDNGKPFSVK